MQLQFSEKYNFLSETEKKMITEKFNEFISTPNGARCLEMGAYLIEPETTEKVATAFINGFIASHKIPTVNTLP